jgi:hypothetical protein
LAAEQITDQLRESTAPISPGSSGWRATFELNFDARNPAQVKRVTDLPRAILLPIASLPPNLDAS